MLTPPPAPWSITRGTREMSRELGETTEVLSEYQTKKIVDFSGSGAPKKHPAATRVGGLEDAGAGPIERILGAWGAVLEVTVRTSDGAALAMMDADIARRVVEVVNEALVNAVKHSGARSAVVDLDVADDGRMRVDGARVSRVEEKR